MDSRAVTLTFFGLAGTLGMAVTATILLHAFPGFQSDAWREYPGTLIAILILVKYTVLMTSLYVLKKNLPIFRALPQQLQVRDAFKTSKFFSGFFHLPVYITILHGLFNLDLQEFQEKFAPILSVFLFASFIEEFMGLLCLGKLDISLNIHHWSELFFILLLREWIDPSLKSGTIQIQAVFIGTNYLHKFAHFVFPLEHLSRISNRFSPENHVLPSFLFSHEFLKPAFQGVFFYHLIVCSAIVISAWATNVAHNGDRVRTSWKILGFVGTLLFWIIDAETLKYFYDMGFGTKLVEMRTRAAAKFNQKTQRSEEITGMIESTCNSSAPAATPVSVIVPLE
jgi:hypothetical protein